MMHYDLKKKKSSAFQRPSILKNSAGWEMAPVLSLESKTKELEPTIRHVVL